MDRYKLAIIGGGAAGLFLASALSAQYGKVAVLEKGERVGRKLSATGNGQGNVTNLNVCNARYFSSTEFGAARAEKLIARYNAEDVMSKLQSLGLLLISDGRGRVYPAGRQASSITDALRFFAVEKGMTLLTGCTLTALEKQDNGFCLRVETQGKTDKLFAERIVLCTGGKAAKNFGSDGTAYAFAREFGHTVTPLYPSLVQLKTDVSRTKTLKGIRVADAKVTAIWQEKNGQERHTLDGDVIFTDYGVSGDAIFRLSAFIADKIERGVKLYIDFLPDFSKEEVIKVVYQKRKTFPSLPFGELLCGIVNNQVGRAVAKCVFGEDIESAAELLKAFPLNVTGTLGFDYAQVTKGGIPMEETDENLQSRFCKGMYFAGEILDVDGQCGGFNLQWAYASAYTVAAALEDEKDKGRGQVCV